MEYGSSGTSPLYDGEEYNRRQVLEGRSALERTSRSLARSNQMAIETEDIGVGIVNELAVQRESLLHSQRRLQDANSGITKSNSLLRTMQRNVVYNKLVLIFIIIIELITFGVLVYLKFLT